MNIIEVRNLRKKYGETQALDGVSFSVEQGEIFGLLGPNGAGKTTTMEILEGVKRADWGMASVFGMDLSEHLEDIKKRTGVVLQNNNFLPGLSLRELLELFAGFYDNGKIIDQLIEEFDLQKIAGSRFSELSGGQRQRFVLALSLLHQPDLLFLDEPTLGLDPAVRQRFWSIILNLNRKGLSILLTTHYMEEAEILCDRVGIIDAGRVLLSDRPVNMVNSLGVVSKIKFMSSKPVSVAELEQLSGIDRAVRDKYSYDLETATPEKSLRSLLAWEKKFSGKIFNLQVRQATLEDVFLKLTGHSLRE
jgi:ABC-2 type transport system ATP-binding protein